MARVLPDTAASTTGLSPFFEKVVASPHSVVTAHLIDEAGQPTMAARDEILDFFRERLLSPSLRVNGISRFPTCGNSNFPTGLRVVVGS